MANLYRVDEMEALIRTELKEPSQAFLTSAMILQTINDGYKDAALKAFCIEHQDLVTTEVGNRLIPFSGHRINYARFNALVTSAIGQVPPSKNWYDAAMSATGQYQTIVSNGDYIYVSSDYGFTWSAKAAISVWTHVAMSADGQYQTAGGKPTYSYVSSDYGQTWAVKGVLNNFDGLDVSSSGQYQTMGSASGIWVSSDYGQNWAKKFAYGTHDVSMTATGAFQVAVTSFGTYISSNYGESWAVSGGSISGAWVRMVISATGQYQTAADGQYTGHLFVSSDSGGSWAEKGIETTYTDIDMSSGGQYQSAVNAHYIYVSSDYGQTWVERGPDKQWYGIALSSDGRYQIADAYGGFVYFSDDYGVTWQNHRTGTIYDYTVAKSMLKVSPTVLGRTMIKDNSPQYWFQWKEYIVVEPVPDAVYEILLFIADYPDLELTATTDYPTSLPPEFQPCIVDYCLYALSLRMKKWKQAAKYYNLYIRNLKKRKKDYIDRKAERRAIHTIPGNVKYEGGQQPWAH